MEKNRRIKLSGLTSALLSKKLVYLSSLPLPLFSFIQVLILRNNRLVFLKLKLYCTGMWRKANITINGNSNCEILRNNWCVERIFVWIDRSEFKQNPIIKTTFCWMSFKLCIGIGKQNKSRRWRGDYMVVMWTTMSNWQSDTMNFFYRGRDSSPNSPPSSTLESMAIWFSTPLVKFKNKYLGTNYT